MLAFGADKSRCGKCIRQSILIMYVYIDQLSSSSQSDMNCFRRNYAHSVDVFCLFCAFLSTFDLSIDKIDGADEEKTTIH